MGTSHTEIDQSELGPLTPSDIGDTDGIFRCFQYPPHHCWPSNRNSQGPVTIKPCHYYFGIDGKVHHDQEETSFEEKKTRSYKARKADALSIKKVFKRIYSSQIPAGPVDLSSAGVEPDFYITPKDRADFFNMVRWDRYEHKR